MRRKTCIASLLSMLMPNTARRGVHVIEKSSWLVCMAPWNFDAKGMVRDAKNSTVLNEETTLNMLNI